MPLEASAPVAVPLASLDVRYSRLRLPQPRHEEAMAASLRRFGQVLPIVASPRGDRYAVVDGFKRLAAAERLGLAELRVRPLALTERAALAAVYGLNRGSRGLGTWKRRWWCASWCGARA